MLKKLKSGWSKRSSYVARTFIVIVSVKRDREIRTSTTTCHEHEFERAGGAQRSRWAFFNSLLRSIRSYPTDVGHIDHLLVRSEAFDLVIGLWPARITPMNLRSFGQRFAAKTVDASDCGIDVLYLKAHVIDAEP
jgi:hypothetical protein